MSIIESSAIVLDSVTIATDEVRAFRDELFGYDQKSAETAQVALNLMTLAQGQIAKIRKNIVDGL